MIAILREDQSIRDAVITGGSARTINPVIAHARRNRLLKEIHGHVNLYAKTFVIPFYFLPFS